MVFPRSSEPLPLAEVDPFVILSVSLALHSRGRPRGPYSSCPPVLTLSEQVLSERQTWVGAWIAG